MRYQSNGMEFTYQEALYLKKELIQDISKMSSEVVVSLLRKDNKFLTMHSLRHTYATRSIEAGAKPEALMVLMGHSDIATTLNIYTSVTEEHKKEQAEKVTQYLEKKNII